MDYDFRAAREQAIWVAGDRVGQMLKEEKVSLLDQIDRSLEQWKQEQMGPDGTIVVESPERDFVWLDSQGNGSDDQDEQVPANGLRPEQCAGPTVQSKSDLFNKLWMENYAPIRKITNKQSTRRDIVMALLVERDGESMPAGSLASALLCIWTHVWVSREEFHKALSTKQAKEAEKAEQLADAQANSVLANMEKARKLNEVIWEKAIVIHLKENFPDEHIVAAKVYGQIKDIQEFKLYREPGVFRRINGAREAALRRLQKEHQKKE